ncbi:probable glycosyltransferase At5g03795 [Chenopodium quinoa]|nr:probable glycosyltransferase At5g03795 [Chenopodium quinoa]
MGYLYFSPLVKLLLCFTIPLILLTVFISFNKGITPNLSFSLLSSKTSSIRVSTKDLRLRIDGEIGGITKEANVVAEDYFYLHLIILLSRFREQDGNETSVIVKEEMSPNSNDIFDETHANASPSPTMIEEKVASDIDKLEIGLQKVRAAIKEAKYTTNRTYQDPDFQPVGPIYWNANAFHRSYIEMEKRFKVFVYEEGESPLFHNGPCKSIYSTEGNFIHQMEVNDQFRTKNPNKAHVFFLPFSVTMMVHYLYQPELRSFDFIKHTVIDYIDVISSKYPFWNRSLAADHFMLSCHDWGPIASFSVPYLKENSIRVLCNANTSEEFQPRKDVSLPEINLQPGPTSTFIGGSSPSNRSILAFFAGGNHGPIRPSLLEHWGNKSDEDMRIHTYLPQNVSYYDLLKNSKYCLCPSGYEVASPRIIVEAIYTGCVPVLISDHYVPPFSDVLNWKAFSVEVAVKDMPNLKTILLSISRVRHMKMYRRVLQVRKHFEVHSPPQHYDFFHMILHSVWLRRLNVQVHDHQEL